VGDCSESSLLEGMTIPLGADQHIRFLLLLLADLSADELSTPEVKASWELVGEVRQRLLWYDESVTRPDRKSVQ
jgi:hypothetical protein